MFVDRQALAARGRRSVEARCDTADPARGGGSLQLFQRQPGPRILGAGMGPVIGDVGNTNIHRPVNGQRIDMMEFRRAVISCTRSRVALLSLDRGGGCNQGDGGFRQRFCQPGKRHFGVVCPFIGLIKAERLIIGAGPVHIGDCLIRSQHGNPLWLGHPAQDIKTPAKRKVKDRLGRIASPRLKVIGEPRVRSCMILSTGQRKEKEGACSEDPLGPLLVFAYLMAGTATALAESAGELRARLEGAMRALGPDYTPRSSHLNADGTPKYINRLILEASPYLLQHAHNPVDWQPWGPESLLQNDLMFFKPLRDSVSCA